MGDETQTQVPGLIQAEKGLKPGFSSSRMSILTPELLVILGWRSLPLSGFDQKFRLLDLRNLPNKSFVETDTFPGKVFISINQHCLTKQCLTEKFPPHSLQDRGSLCM